MSFSALIIIVLVSIELWPVFGVTIFGRQRSQKVTDEPEPREPPKLPGHSITKTVKSNYFCQFLFGHNRCKWMYYRPGEVNNYGYCEVAGCDTENLEIIRGSYID